MLEGIVIGGAIGLGLGLVGAELATSTALCSGNALASFSEVTGIGASSTVVGTTATNIVNARLKTSKYIQQLNRFGQEKINHVINGSKNSVHNWQKLVQDKNWSDVKTIINEVMEKGTESSYKSVLKKVLDIDGHKVTVTFNRMVDGIERISDAWVD